jgi:hypothetical protein
MSACTKQVGVKLSKDKCFEQTTAETATHLDTEQDWPLGDCVCIQYQHLQLQMDSCARTEGIIDLT